MGIINRAFRNISRRKIRALLVIIALGFSLAIMISVPAGIAANQKATQELTQNLSNNMSQSLEMLNRTITQTQATINQTLTQIDCSLTPDAPQNFGFSSSGGGIRGPIGGSQGGPVGISRFGGGPFGGGGSKPMNETTYLDIANVTGVAAVEQKLQVVQGHNQTISPMFFRNGVQSSGQEINITVPDYIITGVPTDSELINSYPVLPTNITEGRNLQANENGAVVLSKNSSLYFGKGVGDSVTILGSDFEVVGVYSPTGVSDNQLVYMNLEDAQTLTNNSDTVTSIHVFANSSDLVTSVANSISSLHPELNVVTSQDRLSQLQNMESMYQNQLETSQSSYQTAIENAQNTMNQTQSQAFQEIIIAVAATSLIMLFVMLYSVRERTKEIGTLKAIGFSNWTVMGQFMLEGVLLSLLAGVVAVAIGAIAAPFLSTVLLPTVSSSTNLFGGGGPGTFTIAVNPNRVTAPTTAVTASLSPELILMAFGAAILLGAVGSLYPAWRAAKTRPAEAMRYE